MNRSFTIVTVFLFMALLTGCGKKTSLIPPRELVPVRITDLQYRLDEKGVTLTWSYPDELKSGDALQSIESFTVYRSAVPENQYCQGCPVQFGEAVEVGGGLLPETEESRTASYRDRNLEEGNRYFYKVRSRAGWWFESDDSNIVSFVWGPAPRAPRNLMLKAADNKLVLSWEPVKADTAGKLLEQVALYQVYRKSSGADFVALGDPGPESEFVDTGVLNGQQYTYKVRALVPAGDSLQAGVESNEISGMIRDLQPPPLPQHLLAVKISEGVKLVWQGVDAEDLEGYRIYRRPEGSGQPEFLAEVGADQNLYIDKTAAPGQKWLYSIASVDTAVPPNESRRSGEEVIDLR